VLRRARTIREEFAFDLIHAHTTVPDGIVAVWLGSIFRVPTVITSHGGDIYLFPANRWNRATLRYTLNRANRVIAVSSNLKKRIVALGASDRKITVIPNGFDPVRFPIGGGAGVKSIHDRSEKRVLFLGQLIPRKDPLIVLESFGRLKARMPDVRLIMVGDGPLRDQVKARIRHLGLADWVDLVGEVPHITVPEYLRSADLLCLPSHAEGWPTVISEALSQGVPVVASRVGGNPEAIYSEDYGLLVEPGDLPGLTEALSRGLTMAWDRTKIRRYAAGFTWGRIAELISQEFQSIMAETRAAIHQAGA
jgi:glycosyltransferase involved in cell wall biosynthesis